MVSLCTTPLVVMKCYNDKISDGIHVLLVMKRTPGVQAEKLCHISSLHHPSCVPSAEPTALQVDPPVPQCHQSFPVSTIPFPFPSYVRHQLLIGLQYESQSRTQSEFKSKSLKWESLIQALTLDGVLLRVRHREIETSCLLKEASLWVLKHSLVRLTRI